MACRCVVYVIDCGALEGVEFQNCRGIIDARIGRYTSERLASSPFIDPANKMLYATPRFCCRWSETPCVIAAVKFGKYLVRIAGI